MKQNESNQWHPLFSYLNHTHTQTHINTCTPIFGWFVAFMNFDGLKSISTGHRNELKWTTSNPIQMFNNYFTKQIFWGAAVGFPLYTLFAQKKTNHEINPESI